MNADTKKRYKDIDFPYLCPLTNRTFKQSNGLSCYVTKTLKMDHSEYYDRYINHRDSSCFFCKSEKGKFISISKGYRNLCDSPECVKKSFSSHSIEGFMYRNLCSREEAEKLFIVENQRQLDRRTETQNKLREEDPLWDKKRSRNCKEFWMEKGLSEEESILKSKEVMTEIHDKTFKKFKDNPEKYASKYTTKIEYYLSKGFSVEDSNKLLKDRQTTFSLEKCIEKYGDEEGLNIWETRQEKWQKSLLDNGNIKGGYSKVSQNLFYDIIELYHNKIQLKDVFFWTKNKEFYIKNQNNIYLYDYTDLNKNKIIEYNGDQYHANPALYSADDMPHPYHKDNDYTAEKIWIKDKKKLDIASKNGFEVLVVWDSEYRKDPKQVIKKCIEFLNS